MAVERQWFYERIASPGEADGRTCIFCRQRLVNESQPGYWVLKAVEDDPDADYVVEDGFAHYTCTQDRLAAGRRRSFELPPVPEGP